MKIIPTFNIDGVKYYDPSMCRLPGEWIIINCDVVHDAVRVYLGLNPADERNNGSSIDLLVDHEKIKLASKNVYNVTHLAYNDSGQYRCDIILFNSTNRTTGEVTRHYLTVLREGKTCIHAMHNANKSHQNEAGRSHRPVAVYLMKLQENRCEKNSF